MTLELLNKIISENNIPGNVHIVSNSGWECSATEMDGMYYNQAQNTIVFTQGYSREYDQSQEWKLLYIPELIRINDLEIYPAASIPGNYEDCDLNKNITKIFKEHIKEAGEFEGYYGVPESEHVYNEINISRPLFYSVKKDGKFIGYIGFNGQEDVLRPEIYIFREFRNNGYGSAVLSKLVDITFKDGLLNKDGSKQTGISEFDASVRPDNHYSIRMLEKCGFSENKEIAFAFMAVMNENDDSEANIFEIRKYSITKEEYLARA